METCTTYSRVWACGNVQNIVECLEEGQRQGKGGVEVDWNTYGKTKVEEYQRVERVSK